MRWRLTRPLTFETLDARRDRKKAVEPTLSIPPLTPRMAYRGKSPVKRRVVNAALIALTRVLCRSRSYMENLRLVGP